MIFILGFVLVSACVFGAFAAHGGNLLVLWQPSEYVIIAGAAAFSLLISSPVTQIKEVVRQTIGAMKDGGRNQAEYTELLLLLYELIKTGKGNILGLEAHVENPETSEIFNRYPSVLKNHHAVHFIADTLKVQISSPVSPYDLDDLMDTDLSSAHKEEHKAAATMGRIADAMPGLGIVAAVLGVVNTMGKLTQGKEVIGHSVAAALVGTFIGVLLSYGYLNPLAAKMADNLDAEGKYLEVAKAGLLAFAKDASPKVCVEFARRSVPPAVRPSFEEIDQATSNVKGKAA
ncbi:MAG: flagellar motor stator protein MotA [Bdellovibrionales bacterium]|nr:flagellar motor stator protein MotA [Bdellovibrionales bacterium]